MKNKITLLILLLFTAFNIVLAQDGTNDPSFNPTDEGYFNGANAPVLAVAVQADGKVIIGGDFIYFKGENRSHIARLNADETLDMSFNPGMGANNKVKSITLLEDGKILIGGEFTEYDGVSRNGVARLNTDGSLDETFNPGENIAVPEFLTSLSVNTVSVQQDGKIILGGIFASAGNTAVRNIIRINTDGTNDATFLATGTNASIYKTLILPDGKIIVSGIFSRFNGVNNINSLCRLNTDGSTDSTFNTAWLLQSQGIDNVALQADGKIVAVGEIMRLVNHNYITTNVFRINTDGSFDTEFNLSIVYGSRFSSVVIQPDGKILVAGAFVFYGEDSFRYLLRVNANGDVDTSFADNSNPYDKHINAMAECMALQPDGKVILGGNFMSYNSVCKHYLLRITDTGNVDDTFTLGNGTGADNTIMASLVQPDGKIIVAGPFNHYNGQVARSVARLNPDGSLDAAFSTGTGANAIVNLCALQPDGKVVIVGNFTTYNGIAVNKAARINTDGTLDTSFNLDSSITIDKPFSMEILANGKILLSAFMRYNNGVDSVDYYTLFKLNADGSLDSSFPITETRPVEKMILLPNGKIVVAYGYFYSNIGIQYTVARLNSDGSLDTTFQVVPFTTMQDTFDMVLQSDGKIVVSGHNFRPSNPAPTSATMLIRLNEDGTTDATFNYIANGSWLTKILLQADGKFIVSGSIYYDGNFTNIARINNDGSYDATFDATTDAVGYFGEITNIHLQPENKLLITGSFYAYNGAGRNRIARIFSSGAMATTQRTAKTQTVFAYKSNDALQVGSVGQAIKGVKVYDMAGRLLSDTKNVNAFSTTVADILHSRLLIVNVKLEDDTVVSKKIYY